MAKFFIFGLLIGALLLWAQRTSWWGGDDWGGGRDVEPGPEDPGEALDVPREPAEHTREKIDS